MRYKPKFCCNCGEKIERAVPSFLDSKMFCDVCKHDFVLQRYAPVVCGALLAMIGIFGVGSWWRSGEQPVNLTARALTTTAVKPSNQTPPVNANPPVQQTAQITNSQTNSVLAVKPPLKKIESAPVSAEETVYFCGAPTKKGTPCSRRVRGGGRCWQHKGQTALLPPEKLLAEQ